MSRQRKSMLRQSFSKLGEFMSRQSFSKLGEFMSR